MLEGKANRRRELWGAFVSLFTLVATFVFPTIFPPAPTDVIELAVWTVRHVALFTLGWAARPLITQVAIRVRRIMITSLTKTRRRVAQWLLQDVRGS